MPTAAEQIAAIDAILASGVSSHTVDGTTTQYDLTSLRKKRAELIDELAGYRTKQRCVAVRLDG
jgi:hypothetical protein